MSKKDLEDVRDALSRWQRRLKRAIETEQLGMKSITEQKVEIYEQLLREQA